MWQSTKVSSASSGRESIKLANSRSQDPLSFSSLTQPNQPMLPRSCHSPSLITANVDSAPSLAAFRYSSREQSKSSGFRPIVFSLLLSALIAGCAWYSSLAL